MTTTEMAVTVNVADLDITKEVVLAAADVLTLLCAGVVVHVATDPAVRRLRAAVLAFAHRDERSHVIPAD